MTEESSVQRNLDRHEDECSLRYKEMADVQREMREDLARHREKTEATLLRINDQLIALSVAVAERAGAAKTVAGVVHSLMLIAVCLLGAVLSHFWGAPR